MNRANKGGRLVNDQMRAIIEDVNALVIINYGIWIDPLFFYFTQLRSGVYERSAVIITTDETSLLTTNLEVETARSELNDVQVYSYKRGSEFFSTISKICAKHPIIGLNYEGIPHSAYLALTKQLSKSPSTHDLKDLSVELEAARLIKPPEELEKLRTACKIAAHVANDIPSYDHPDEKTIAANIEYNMRKEGATSIAFQTIAAIGSNSADPHYTTGDRPAKSGEFLLTDFGAKYAHYNSDISRTFIFEKADLKARKMYEIVLQAQREAIDAIHAGVSAKDVDAIARNILDKDYPDRFIHSLGHGLGLEVHDGGRLAPGSDLILEEGMVFTIEPGIYLRDYGGVHIEDNVIVTKNGVELLTPAKKDELIEL